MFNNKVGYRLVVSQNSITLVCQIFYIFGQLVHSQEYRLILYSIRILIPLSETQLYQLFSLRRYSGDVG